MDCGVCLLESHEKDTARKFKTVSGVRIINMCFDYMFFSSLFISGLSSSNKGIAASRGKRDRGWEGMKKKYKDMTLEEKIEYAKKRAERSDRFTTFALIFVSICWFLILTIEVIIKFCV